jgi:hypothetical protein
VIATRSGPAAQAPILPHGLLERDQLQCQLAAVRHELLPLLAHAAWAFASRQGWLAFGYTEPADFARERLDRGGRWLRELAALHRLFEKFPALARAVTGRDGGAPVGQEAALVIGRVATPESLGGWIETARRLGVRDLDQAVRAERARRAAGAAGAGTGTEDASTDASAGTAEVAGPAGAGGPSASANLDEDTSAAAIDPDAASGPAAGAAASTLSDGAAGAPATPWVPGPSSVRFLDGLDEGPDSERSYLQMPVPPEAQVGFREAHGLHRAVVASEVGIEPWVEALVAESLSGGGWDGQVDLRAVLPGPSRAERERALAAASKRWQALSRAAAAVRPEPRSRPMRAALGFIARYGEIRHRLEELDGQASRICRPRSGMEPDRVHWELYLILREVGRMQGRAEIRSADLLAEMADLGAWRALGFDSLEQYAADRLGWSRTTARTRVQLARSLRKLAEVRAAYEMRRIGLEAAQWLRRLLAEKSSPAVQRAWIEHAATLTIKRLRDEAQLLGRERLLARTDRALAAIGCAPPDAEAWRAWGALGLDGCSPATDCAPDDDGCSPATDCAPDDDGCSPAAACAHDGDGCPACAPECDGCSPAVAVAYAPGCAPWSACANAPRTAGWFPRGVPIASPEEAGIPDDATWQRSLYLAPGQTRARILYLGNRMLVRVVHKQPLLEVPLRLRLRREVAEDFVHCLDAARQALAARFAQELPPHEDSRLTPSERIARAYVAEDRRLPLWVGLLWLLEQYVDLWDDPRGMPRRPTDPVCNRESWRCIAPGCTRRGSLQVHHIQYRSHRGGEAMTNKAACCVLHHQLGEHGGLARCRGTAPLDLVWRLGKPCLATWYRNERFLGSSCRFEDHLHLDLDLDGVDHEGYLAGSDAPGQVSPGTAKEAVAPGIGPTRI